MRYRSRTVSAILLLCVLTQARSQDRHQRASDTTYHSANHAIQSIIDYNPDSTVGKYRQYYLNGELFSYTLYFYQNKSIIKEEYYDKNNTLTGYGEYASTTGTGKDFKVFTKDGILLFKTLYAGTDTVPWQLSTFIAYAGATTVRYSQTYEYYNGWLKTIRYFDHNNGNYATGAYDWIPSLQVTTYTFSLHNGKRWYHPVYHIWYDRSVSYYYNDHSYADSMKFYCNDTVVLNAQYEYNPEGWMLKDKYFNNANVQTCWGEYTFNTSTLETSYKFYRSPDNALSYHTVYDFKGFYNNTAYYKNSGVEFIVKYEYNSAGYYSKVRKESPTGTLISYETYDYYEPYYYFKQYTAYNADNVVTSYYKYNEVGEVIDSMVVSDIIYKNKTMASHRVHGTLCNNNLIIITGRAGVGTITLYTVNGKVLLQLRSVMLREGMNRFPINKHAGAGILFLDISGTGIRCHGKVNGN